MKHFVSICALAAAPGLMAAIIATPEAAGVQSTTTPGTTTVTFNTPLPLGPLGAYASTIGNYSAGAQVLTANTFGGAGGSDFVSVGAQSNTLSYTLSFGSDQSFFGLYWEAMDPQNVLTFMEGSTVVGTFTAASLASQLTASGYNGNPSNGGADAAEKFAYIDFTGTAGTVFNSVVFSNLNGTTGFESDNHSILASSTPEPGTGVLLLMGMGGVVVGYRRKKQTKA